MTKYQQREANFILGFHSKNIRRTLLGIKKGSQAYIDIIAGRNAAKREKLAGKCQRSGGTALPLTDEEFKQGLKDW